jgi:hypothetical protein
MGIGSTSDLLIAESTAPILVPTVARGLTRDLSQPGKS